MTSANLSPTTLTQSQVRNENAFAMVTLQTQAPIAPINGFSMKLHNSAGDVVWQLSGGTSADPGGTLLLVLSLPSDIAAGVYPVSVGINDASGLASAYGAPGGQPFPGGPLELTITAD